MLNFIAISIVLSIYLTVSVGAPIMEVQAIHQSSWKFATVRAIPAIIGVQVLMSVMNPFVIEFIGKRVSQDDMPAVYPLWIASSIIVCVVGFMLSTRENKHCTVCEYRRREWDSEMCWLCQDKNNNNN